MNLGAGEDEFLQHQGVGMRLLNTFNCPPIFAPAITTSHLGAQVLLIPFQECSLSLHVSQNKEPSRALRSDTKVIITCVLDCLKKKVEKEGEKKSSRHKRKSEKILIPAFKGSKLTNLGTFSLCCF